MSQIVKIDGKLRFLWDKFTLKLDSRELDFFDAGGDSLSAINMIVEVQNEYGIQLSLEKFMSDPYLAALQDMINTLRMEERNE